MDVEVVARTLEALLAEIDAHSTGPACALRVDGEFELVRARSVPRQHPPYRPLAEVAAEQHVFELEDVSGTLVGVELPPGVELGEGHVDDAALERIERAG